MKTKFKRNNGGDSLFCMSYSTINLDGLDDAVQDFNKSYDLEAIISDEDRLITNFLKSKGMPFEWGVEYKYKGTINGLAAHIAAVGKDQLDASLLKASDVVMELKLLKDDIASDDYQSALVRALRLVRLSRGLVIARAENEILAGLGVLCGSKKGGKANGRQQRKETADEKKIKYQQYIDELYQENSWQKYSDLKLKAANKFQVSTKTIGRYTINKVDN